VIAFGPDGKPYVIVGDLGRSLLIGRDCGVGTDIESGRTEAYS
jgi:hypothetical protein